MIQSIDKGFHISSSISVLTCDSDNKKLFLFVCAYELRSTSHINFKVLGDIVLQMKSNKQK